MHYDPSYQSSIERNFSKYSSAKSVHLDNDSDEAFARAAKVIMETIKT